MVLVKDMGRLRRDHGTGFSSEDSNVSGSVPRGVDRTKVSLDVPL